MTLWRGDLGGDGIIRLGGRCAAIGLCDDLGQRDQPVQDVIDVDAVVDQAGDFGHADGLDLFDAGQRILDGAEQAGVVEIALEGEVEDAFQLVLVERAEIELERRCRRPWVS